MSADDVARHLGIAKDTVYRWVRREGLPAHRVGRLLKFRLSEVDRWVSERRTSIQVVIRGRPATTLPVVERIKAHSSAPARELAAWLGAHLHGGDLVERERYLVVPADDLETLSDRCASLEASLRRIGLPLERIQSVDELRGGLGAFLTPRPRQFRPGVVDISAR